MSLEFPRNIGLIGFMASGKTVVGKALAIDLKFDFIDTDAVIEERVGKSIPDIFNDFGEEFFRQVEHEVVKEICMSKSCVISFGGGVVLSPTNIKTIRENTTVILLVASADEIYSRVKGDNQRPLLDNNDGILKDNIQSLLIQRDSQYTDAMHIKIETDGKSVSEIVSEIVWRVLH